MFGPLCGHPLPPKISKSFNLSVAGTLMVQALCTSASALAASTVANQPPLLQFLLEHCCALAAGSYGGVEEEDICPIPALPGSSHVTSMCL